MTKERYNELRSMPVEQFLFRYYLEETKNPIVTDINMFMQAIQVWVSTQYGDIIQGIENILRILDTKFVYIRIIK